MSKNIILIPDKSFFHILFDSEIDAYYCDRLETIFGNIILGQEHYLELDKMIGIKIDKYFPRDAWRIYINRYHDSFLSILDKIADKQNIDIKCLYKDIDAYHLQFKERIQAINPGTSNEDISLVAISCFINQYTDYIPCIISEDSDLLISAQLLCSLYGLPSMIHSIYELVTSTGESDIIEKYLKNKGISIKSHAMNKPHSKDDCLEDLSILCQKNLIAFHPSLEKKELFHNATRTGRLK